MLDFIRTDNLQQPVDLYIDVFCPVQQTLQLQLFLCVVEICLF